MMAPPKQKRRESLSEEPDSDGSGASAFILKPISPSKRRPDSIPRVSGAKTKKKKKKTTKDEAAAAVTAVAAEMGADKHRSVSADAGVEGEDNGNGCVGVTRMKKIKSVVVQVVQKGVNKDDDDETLKEKSSGGEMIPPSGGGGGTVDLEEGVGDDSGQSNSRKGSKKMSNKSNKENNKKEEKVKQKKIKEEKRDEEKISGIARDEKDNAGNRKDSKKSKRTKAAKEIEEEKQESPTDEEIRGNLFSAEDAVMSVAVKKEKENEDQDQEGEEEKEPHCKMEDFWSNHPNLKQSMETGMFGPMLVAGKWLSSNSLGREKAKELEQKWMSLQKAETDLFHEKMVLIEEEIGGVLSSVVDP